MTAIPSPMFASKISHPFSHADWLFEPIQKGKRLTARALFNKIIFYESNQEKAFEVEFFKNNQLHDCDEIIFDGVLFSVNPGIDVGNFSEVPNLLRSGILKYMVHDLLKINRVYLYSVPLLVRKQFLSEVFKKIELSYMLQVNYICNDGIRLYNDLKSEQFSGIMAKKVNSGYAPLLRSKEWLKITYGDLTIVRIVGIKSFPINADVERVESLILAEEKNRVFTYAGNCNTGFTIYQSEWLYSHLMKSFTGKKCVLVNLQSEKDVKWLNPNNRCLVRFRTRNHKGRLIQPVFCSLRA